MPDYMRTLWQSGLCPYLVPAAFYEDRGRTRRILRAEGLIQVRDYAALCPDGIEDSFCRLLEMLSSAADSMFQLQLWMADPPFISLRPEDLYYTDERKTALLLFSGEPDPRPFSARFCDLCSGLGGSGDLIASRLSEACGCRILEEKAVSAFLQNCSREIRAER